MTVAQMATTGATTNSPVQPASKVQGKEDQNDGDMDQQQWFAALLAIPVAGVMSTNVSADMSTETEPLADSAAPLPEGLDILCDQVDELAAEPKDFDCTMLLPHLGEVRVSAQHTPQNWQIQLEFVQRQAYEQARKSKRRLNRQLGERLGKPVQLSIVLRGGQEDG